MLGVLAGCISLLAFFPYTFAILKGETKPNRTTWFIWSCVSLLLFLSYKETGAKETLWIALIYAITPFLTALLSIKYGVGGYSKFDLWCFAGSIIVSLLWLLSEDALTALYLFLVIDFIGTIPTLKKTYFFPGSENKLGWSLMVIANCLNIFASKEISFSIIIYPVYMFVIGAIILGLTFRNVQHNQFGLKAHT